MENSVTVDIQDFMNRQSFTVGQFRIAAFCALATMIDGYDTQIMSFVAPLLSNEMKIDRIALGGVFSAGLFGMLIGSILVGFISDRFGRRPALLGSLIWTSLAMFSTIFSTSVHDLMAVRFVTGIGLGGALPISIAMTSENVAKRVRMTTVMLMYCFFSVGGALAALVTDRLIAHLPWTSVFIVGGTATAILVLFMIPFLPESIMFVVAKERPRNQVIKTTKLIAPSIPVDKIPFFTSTPQDKNSRQPLWRLFAEGRAPITILLWITFASGYLVIYFMLSWLPSMLRDDGLNIHQSFLIATAFQLGTPVGAIVLGRLIDRFQASVVLGSAFVIGSGFIYLISIAKGSVALLCVFALLAGGCIVAGMIGFVANAASLYPTSIRSTAVGWGLGMGRAGGIVGPTLGGILLAMHFSADSVFRLTVVPELIAGLSTFALVYFSRKYGNSENRAIRRELSSASDKNCSE
jgi:MFS transporter, AAHS family, 4-hydroxybenzoate transporter